MTIDGDHDVKEICMFESGMYNSMFYCLCYFKEISTDMLEEQVSEERDPDLNDEEDIIMEDRREEHWRDVAEYGDNKFYIHALWDVYTREEGGLIKRYFLVSGTHPKGGDIFYTFVKDNIIKEKD